MEELFQNIPEEFRKRVKFIVDMALRAQDIPSAAYALKAFADTCSEEEQEFLDFYFNCRMENLLNANSNN